MFIFRFLIRVVLLLFLICLLHRFWVYLTGAVKSEGGLPPRDDQGTPMVLDPECHTHIPLTDALSATINNKTVHFCSRECRDAYLARNQPRPQSHT